MVIKGVHSVLISTDDVGRLAPFYRDIVGLKVAMEGDDFAVFEAGSGSQLALGVHSEVKGRSKEPDRIMVDLEVDSCQAEYDRLRAKGVEFMREPGEDEGFIVATLLDPDGNQLQLFQVPGSG